MLTLREIMTRDVVTIAPETPLSDVAELLSARHIGGVPVVSGRQVVGVVSAADVLNLAATAMIRPAERPDADEDVGEDAWARSDDLGALDEEGLLAGFFSGDWDVASDDLEQLWKDEVASGRNLLRESTAGDVMTSEVLSLPAWTPVSVAAAFMRRNGVHRLLVMDGDELQGIISTMDIVKAVAERRIGGPVVSPAREADFDSTWSHEPVIPEVDR